MTEAGTFALTLAEAARAGTPIRCPDCMQAATASLALAGRDSGGRPVASVYWVRVTCSRCGAKLHTSSLHVEAIDPRSGGGIPRDLRPLNRAVGKFVRCPIPGCYARSRAVHRDDHKVIGHAVECPIHQVRAYDPETEVEVIE